MTTTGAGADLVERASVTPCSRGLVALTFDDGPSPTVTPRVLDLLERRRVPATFFVVGQRVAAHGRIVRRMHAHRFVVANHTYRHEQLTALSSGAVATTLRRTRRAIVAAGAVPSPLMRPPYGAINARVRAVVRSVGMVPVLWDVDPRNWNARSSTAIASAVLRGLQPGRDNVVLLHDGVANSGNTLRALPTIVRGARSRGYCFARLDRRGRIKTPVPAASVADRRVTEGHPGRPGRLRFVVRLSTPTSRATSVRVRTVATSAQASKDYRPVDFRLRFPVGATSGPVTVPVLPDALDEPVERLEVRLSAPRGMRLPDRVAVGSIVDDDPAPDEG